MPAPNRKIRPHKKNVDPDVARERASKAARARTTVDYHIEQLAKSAPALNADQLERIRALLRPVSGAA